MVSGGKMEFGRWKLGVQGSGLSGAGFSLSMDDNRRFIRLRSSLLGA